MAVSVATKYGLAVESVRPRRNRWLPEPERLDDAIITAENWKAGYAYTRISCTGVL